MRASAVTTPRNQNAGLLGIRNRSARQASIEETDTKEIVSKVNSEVERKVAELETTIAETRQHLSTNQKLLDEGRKKFMAQIGSMNGHKVEKESERKEAARLTCSTRQRLPLCSTVDLSLRSPASTYWTTWAGVGRGALLKCASTQRCQAGL